MTQCSLRTFLMPLLGYLFSFTLSHLSYASDITSGPQPGASDGDACGRAKAEEKSADSATRESELAPIPVLFTTPETGIGGGGAVVYLGPQNGLRRDFGLIGISYTQQRQLLSAGFYDRYSRDEQWAWEASYRLTNYPDYFFGIGPKTSSEDREFYTMRSKEFGTGIRWLPYKRLQLGVGLRQELTSFDDFKSDQILASGDIPGAEGGRSRFLILSVRYDTVDDVFSPKAGLWFRWEYRRDNRNFGSHFDTTKQILNTSYFIPVTPKASLGTQLYAEIIQGEVPWYQMAQVGGRNLLRGYYAGRYRDNNMGLVQSEWRQDLAGKWGWVAFIGAGQVGPTAAEIVNRQPLVSGGTGLRYRLTTQQRINVRLDLGWAKDAKVPSTYLYILEAF